VRLIELPETKTVAITEDWRIVKDGDSGALELYERHYSCYQYADNRQRRLFIGPGEKIVLLSAMNDALFAWRVFMENGRTQPLGVNCSVFRNEGEKLSSDLILQAERVAWCRWPKMPLYTYVNPAKIRRSRSPGRCFLKAGWSYYAVTKSGLLVLVKLASQSSFARVTDWIEHSAHLRDTDWWTPPIFNHPSWTRIIRNRLWEGCGQPGGGK